MNKEKQHYRMMDPKKGVTDSTLLTALLRLFPFLKNELSRFTEVQLSELTTEKKVIEALGQKVTQQRKAALAIAGTVKRFNYRRQL